MSGYWNDDNCGKKRGFVCKKHFKEIYKPLKPNELPVGNCPNGWIKAGQFIVF